MFRRFFIWIRGSRGVRRCLYGLASFATLVLLFYAEEDWRGKRDWEQYKREWEAKGERFDFAAFVPAAVPDDQNFALTPIVGSTYAEFLDRHGNVIEPPDTNVVDRLALRLDSPPAWKPWPTNDFTGHWEFGMKTDLQVYQAYYRAPVCTNPPPRSRGYRGGGMGHYALNPVLGATNEFPTSAQPQSPAADVLLALSRYDNTIEELRKATRLPRSRFPRNYDGRPILETVRLPALGSLTQCSKVLRLRAVAELANGQSEKAVDDIKLVLYLANSLQNEPFEMSQLARASLVNFAMQPLWEGLHDHKLSDTELSDLGAAMSPFDFLSDYQLVVRSERASAVDSVEYCERSRGFLGVCRAFFSFRDDPDNVSSWTRGFEETKWYLMPRGWFSQNEIPVARMFQQSLLSDAEYSRRIFCTSTDERRGAELLVDEGRPSLFHLFAWRLQGRSGIRFAFAQSALDQARVASGLERYRLAHDEYPATLDELPPKFIDRLPHDIINGQPLHYRRTVDGHFLLYSIGWNGIDDGGIVVRNEYPSGFYGGLDKGDWAWPYQPVPIPSKTGPKVFGKPRGLRY